MSADPEQLSDEDLLAAFEGEGFTPGTFHHRHHVRLAWVYLERHSAEDVLPRFARGLRRMAARAGNPGLYHETITWAYLLLVNERRQPRGEEGWEAFARRSSDLLEWSPSILERRYYRADTLWSDRARQRFVMPDLTG